MDDVVGVTTSSRAGDTISTTSRQPFFVAYIGCLIVIASLSLYFLPHILQGDALSYVDAAKAYAQGQHLSIDLSGEITREIVAVHRMLTTTLGIQALRFFSTIAGSFEVGWLLMDTVLFFGGSIVLYLLLARFYESERVAFIGGLFYAGNYSMLSQGMGYFMDIGGWFFYLLALLLIYLYIESGRYRMLVIAALTIAVGGFFKENAYMASIPLGAILLFEYYKKPLTLLAKSVPLGLLVVGPAVLQHLYIYREYGYTYAYWIHVSQDYYEYNSVIVEYIKSFGSLLTFLAPVALIGAYEFVRRFFDPTLDHKKKVFLVSVLASSIPAVLWPAITQRVLFLAVPGLILLAGLCIKRFERYWYAFVPLIILYLLAALTMDSFILNYVNLPM
ncbi:glycosyltransferase family 39 protein [Candidatus Kaiserbacteria bacterium]|nr:glycosyltransferase family 39 protein [Candidatus Kaiserbacteria bacterium]